MVCAVQTSMRFVSLKLQWREIGAIRRRHRASPNFSQLLIQGHLHNLQFQISTFRVFRECLFCEVNFTSSGICQTYSFNDILWRLSMCAYHMVCAYHMDLIVGSTYLCMHTIVTTYQVSIKQICSQKTFLVFLNHVFTICALLKSFPSLVDTTPLTN